MHSRFIHVGEGRYFNVEQIFLIWVGTSTKTGELRIRIYCEPANEDMSNFCLEENFIPDEIKQLLQINDDGSQKK